MMNQHGNFRSRFQRANALKPVKPLVNPVIEWSLRKGESAWIFGISLVLNLVLAYFLFFVWHIGNSDALSRTANAYYVLYSRDPHLAAIGFVWPPLSSIMQLPLLPITKALGVVTFTGSIISALFGALSMVLMNRLLADLKFPVGVRWTLLLLLQLHPDTWYLFSAGMAEPVFLFFFIATLLGMNNMPKTMRSWVIVGISISAAFLVRYEALAMIVAVVMAVIVHMWVGGKDWLSKTEGWILAVLMPPIYTFALWMFFNWTLMGDPLYFARSVYSLSNAPDIAEIAGVGHPLYLAWGNIIESIVMGFRRSYAQSPAYPLMGVLAFASIVRHQDRKNFGLFIMMLSITAFTIFQVYRGSLANWMRYWFYAAPFALVMAGIVHEQLKRKWRKPFYVLLIALCISAIPVSLQAMRDPQGGGDEQRLSALVLDSQAEEAIREDDGYWIYLHDAPVVAAVVDQYSEKGDVMVDASSGFSVIMSVEHPQRLYISNDEEFFQILANPVGIASYMLVLDPRTEGSVNAINLTYPTLYDHGADWAELVWDSGDETINHWRLYEVVSME